MKVSIIVPVYNVEQYIDRCINSIMNQTYKNIECIFIDDCSPDNCFEILNKRIKEYNGVIDFRIIKHSINKGLSGARNTGTYSSIGDYIYYLDSDDEISPNCIETLVLLAIKYKGVEVVQGNTKTIPYTSNDWRDIKLKKFPEYVDNKTWLKKHCLIRPRIPVNAWNKLLKRDFLMTNNLLFKEGIIHEDEHWMFFVAKKLTSISFSESYSYIHYIVNGSIMQSGNNYKSLLSNSIILEELTSNVDSFLPSCQRQYIYYRIKSNMIKINHKNEDDKKLIPKFRSIIYQNMKVAIKSLRIIDFLALLIFCMPNYIYNSYIGRMISALLIRLVY